MDLRGGAARPRLEFGLAAPQPSLQVRHEPGLNFLAQCAFPYDCDSPAGVEEVMPVTPVTLNVGLELCQPEFRPGGRDGRVRAAGMTVPKAPVNETCRSEPPKHQIGCAGKFAVVQAVSQPASMKGPTQSHLGPRVPAPDSRHHAGTGCLINYIRHCRSLDVTEVCRRLCSSPEIPC